MSSASRYPVLPLVLRPDGRKRRRWSEGPADGDRGHHAFVDPWRVNVCGRCPLDDCILPEGGIHGQRGAYIKRAQELCPAERAKSLGWDAAQALERAGQLGLLEAE